VEPAVSESPQRPAGIPGGASWNATLDKWETVLRAGTGGAREGECLRFRPDGTLFSRSRFVADLEEGPFTVYHPDGSIAREGQYVAGRVDGIVNVHTSADGAGEPLRGCCVPPGATRMEIRYRSGDYLLDVFYDREGRALLSDGTLRPARPASVPELVEFNESRGAWVSRSRTLDRWWTAEGVLFEEEERLADGRRVTRVYDPTGVVREERGVDGEGRLAGPYHRRFAPAGVPGAQAEETGPKETVGAPSPYADPRIREERGSFEAGQPVGVWTFLDEAGEVVRTVDRGIAVATTLAELSPAFAPALADGWALARELLAQSRVREALCAAARAAARAGTSQREALVGFLREHVVALAPAVELARGEALMQAEDLDVPGTLNALVCGADAAFAFRSLASVTPGAGPALADLIEASFLLAPGRSSTHITRALLRIQHGNEAGARDDVRVVAADAPAAAASLGSYLDVVFRPFAAPQLWAELALAPASGGEPTPPVAQSLEAIQNLAAVYATRLMVVREQILALLAGDADRAVPGRPSPTWLPPDLTALVPDGPVELQRETIACDPNPETGQAETIEIDEQVALAGMNVPGLLSLAHADHAALAWLCWSTGREDVALPGAVDPPATLVAGMRTIIQRHWRAEDRVKTGGLMALAKKVPGFEWHGQDVDDMPPHILSIARAELLAVRSMFLWLLSPDAMSPFQDDIRDA
jgi:hypothetical protein